MIYIYGIHIYANCLKGIFVSANTDKGLTDLHKYFTFGSHISSFTCMIIQVFLVWYSYFLLQMLMKC